MKTDDLRSTMESDCHSPLAAVDALLPGDMAQKAERIGVQKTRLDSPRGAQSGAARRTRAADRGKGVSWKAAIDLIAGELFSLGREHVERRPGNL
jgi:hypothetical protein